MAVDMFLKIDDIKGEAQDAKHKDEIEVLSWSWGVTQSGSSHTGSGGGAGKVNVNDLSFTKHVDRSTPNLFRNCCTGKHMANAVLVVRKAGGTALEYLKITLSEVIVTGVSTGGSGGEVLTENVTLNFAKVKLDYIPQKKDGSGDGIVTMGWDIATSTAT